jgi:hypothetical protein
MSPHATPDRTASKRPTTRAISHLATTEYFADGYTALMMSFWPAAGHEAGRGHGPGLLYILGDELLLYTPDVLPSLYGASSPI